MFFNTHYILSYLDTIYYQRNATRLLVKVGGFLCFFTRNFAEKQRKIYFFDKKVHFSSKKFCY